MVRYVAPRPRRVPALAALTALAVAVAAPAAARAEFVAPPGSPYATGSDPYNVYAADLSRDGVPDLVTINGTTSNVSVLYQGGNGVFMPFGDFGVGSGGGPNLGATGDFNADGRTDIAVMNSNGGGGSNPYGVTILMHNSGDDQFTAADYLPVGPSENASGVATGDFNADGKTDVAVSLRQSGQIAIFVRKTDNTGFTPLAGSPFVVGPADSLPGDIAVGDLDGANGPDLAVVLPHSNQVSALLSQPGGGYAKPAGMPMSVGTGPIHVVIAPLNGDALPDLAVSNFASGNVTVLNRVAAGGFTQAAGSPFEVGVHAVGLGAGDFNGDSKLDLAVADSGDNAIDILRNDGSGDFTRQPPIPSAPTVTPYGLVVGDFTQDGKPDIAFTALGTDNVGLLDNTSGGPPTVITRPVASGTARPDHPLSCDPGTWAEVPTSFTTTWERGPTSGDTGFAKIADGDTYNLTTDDIGHGVRCRVVAANSEGSSESAVSDAIAVTANQPPEIREFSVAGVGIRGARLNVFINPQALGTTYWITYGIAGTGMPRSTEHTRLVNPRPFTNLDGLNRGTPFEFQLHASNAAGQTDSPVITATMLAGTAADRIYALDDAGQLVVMNADGGGRHRVALKGLGSSNISAINGAISPDGTRVALVSHPCKRRVGVRSFYEPPPPPPVDSGCTDKTRVDVANLDGSASWEVMDESYSASHVNPAWAPNGRVIAVIVDPYYSRDYNAGVYVQSVPPNGEPPGGLTRGKDVYRYDAVAWEAAEPGRGHWPGDGLLLGGTSTDLTSVHYYATPPWDTSQAIQFSEPMGEIVNWPTGCHALGACSRAAHLRPEPANLGEPLGDPADVMGVAWGYPGVDERCTACAKYSGSQHSFYSAHNNVPGVPAAFSPQGDELLLNSGIAVDPSSFAVTRTLANAGKLRRVIGWTGCGDACVPVTAPPAWKPSVDLAVIAPGAGSTTTTITAHSSTTFGDTSIVSAVRGFKKTKVHYRAGGPPDCENHTVAAGESCAITISFDGKTPGKVSARIFPNATNDPTASFVVKATGKGPTPKARSLKLSPKPLKTSSKSVTVTYKLTGAAKVSAALVKSGERGHPFGEATTKTSRRSGKLTLRVNRKLTKGSYTLRAFVVTDRYHAPVKTVRLTIRR
jgi:hypothetical protein